MYWHRRRPHEAYTYELPSFNSIHQLRLAYCCRVKAMLNNFIPESLCDLCYSLSPNKTYYQTLYSHFLSDGYNPPIYNCINCHSTLITQYPLLICHLCTRIHLDMLTRLEKDDRDIDSLPDPTIIYVSGQEFILRQ